MDFQRKENIYNKLNGLKEGYIIHDIYSVFDKSGRKRNKLKVSCKEGHYYEVSDDNYKKGDCPICRKAKISKINRKYTDEEIENKINSKNLKWINKSEFFINIKRPSIFITECIICGHIAKCNITNIFSERKCGGCCNTVKRSTNEAQNILDELYDGEYLLIGEYMGARERSKFYHTLCKNEFNVDFHSLQYGRTECPYCNLKNKSIGERRIMQILLDNNINFKSEYWFDDCRYKYPLRFDFVIFNKNDKNNVDIIIEFDGIQHYEPKDFFGGIDGYNELVMKDEIKNDYCRKNKIPLIRIPYWDLFNISSILRINKIII